VLSHLASGADSKPADIYHLLPRLDAEVKSPLGGERTSVDREDQAGGRGKRVTVPGRDDHGPVIILVAFEAVREIFRRDPTTGDCLVVSQAIYRF
jgi:hypothetical protein